MVDGVLGRVGIAVGMVLKGVTVLVIILLLITEASGALVNRRKRRIATSVMTVPIDVTKSVKTILAGTNVNATQATRLSLQRRKSVLVRIFLLFL